MGMEAVLVQVTPTQLREFESNPQLAYEYVTGDPGGEDEAARMQAIAQATFDRMGLPAGLREKFEQELRTLGYAGAQRGPQLVKPAKSQPEKKLFSLNKDWHVLHYALNGTSEGGDSPLAFAVFGDKELTLDEGVDYGSPRCLTPEQVREVSAALRKIEPASLLSRLNYEDAKKKRIYLDHTLNDLDNWSYLPTFFEEFRNFYSEAVRLGNGMIMKIV